jgi:hypothetical protein
MFLHLFIHSNEQVCSRESACVCIRQVHGSSLCWDYYFDRIFVIVHSLYKTNIDSNFATVVFILVLFEFFRGFLHLGIGRIVTRLNND